MLLQSRKGLTAYNYMKWFDARQALFSSQLLFFCSLRQLPIGPLQHIVQNDLTAINESRLQGKILLYFNPLTAKLFNLNFYPLEVVSR